MTAEDVIAHMERLYRDAGLAAYRAPTDVVPRINVYSEVDVQSSGGSEYDCTAGLPGFEAVAEAWNYQGPVVMDKALWLSGRVPGSDTTRFPAWGEVRREIERRLEPLAEFVEGTTQCGRASFHLEISTKAFVPGRPEEATDAGIDQVSALMDNGWSAVDCEHATCDPCMFGPCSSMSCAPQHGGRDCTQFETLSQRGALEVLARSRESTNYVWWLLPDEWSYLTASVETTETGTTLTLDVFEAWEAATEG